VATVKLLLGFIGWNLYLMWSSVNCRHNVRHIRRLWFLSCSQKNVIFIGENIFSLQKYFFLENSASKYFLGKNHSIYTSILSKLVVNLVWIILKFPKIIYYLFIFVTKGVQICPNLINRYSVNLARSCRLCALWPFIFHIILIIVCLHLRIDSLNK
jgi:hypothetical protein